jgi:hypothetical protein
LFIGFRLLISSAPPGLLLFAGQNARDLLADGLRLRLHLRLYGDFLLAAAGTAGRLLLLQHSKAAF